MFELLSNTTSTLEPEKEKNVSTTITVGESAIIFAGGGLIWPVSFYDPFSTGLEFTKDQATAVTSIENRSFPLSDDLDFTVPLQIKENFQVVVKIASVEKFIPPALID